MLRDSGATNKGTQVRVLTLIPRYVPKHNAGSEIMVARLNRVLVNAGHDVRVITTWHESRQGYVHAGIPVDEVSGAEVDALIDAFSPDVILTQYNESARAARISAGTGIPWAALIHKDNPDAVASLASGPHLAVFNTRHLLAHFAGYTGCSLVVHPPVFAAEHATTPGAAVTLVNLSADKGAGVFYALADRFPSLSFLGVIGGYGQQDIRTHQPNVRIHDHTTNMRDVWCQTRVVLMPSVTESYGLVAAEAMTSGIPVIAHPTSGLRECLGVGGLFADRDDLEAWVATLESLTRSDCFTIASAYARFRAHELATAGTDELSAFVAALEDLAHSSSSGGGPVTHRAGASTPSNKAAQPSHQADFAPQRRRSKTAYVCRSAAGQSPVIY